LAAGAGERTEGCCAQVALLAQAVLSPHVGEDLDRIVEHLQQNDAEVSQERIHSIVIALDVLETSPWMGRPVEHGLRELVIGSGAAGCVALYRYLPELDTVFILAVRGQREVGHRGV
jgi:toxin ParE1/3/4